MSQIIYKYETEDDEHYAVKTSGIKMVRLSQFVPNPDDTIINFHGINIDGIRDVSIEKYDIFLQGNLVRITSRKTGTSVVSKFDWYVM